MHLLVSKSFATLIVLSSAVSSYAQEAAPLKASYKAAAVAENVYVIHGPREVPSPVNQGFMNNPGFVLTDKGVVVIDPGSSVQTGRMVLDQVSTITDMPVIATLSTHIHGDHWLGNQAIRERYPQAALYAHPDLISMAQAGEATNWISLLSRMTEGATEGTKAVIPELPVNDGDVLKFGATSFEIHHRGKAHTITDIAIVVKPSNVMFTGDLVFNDRMGRMDDGHFGGSIETLDHLIALQPEVVVPGHGFTGDITIIEKMRKLFGVIMQTIKVKYEEGLSDFEVKPWVVKELDEFTGWSGFDEAIGRLTSIGYLEVEEESF